MFWVAVNTITPDKVVKSALLIGWENVLLLIVIDDVDDPISPTW